MILFLIPSPIDSPDSLQLDMSSSSAPLGTPRAIVSSVIRALSGLGPRGDRDVQSARLDTDISREEESGGELEHDLASSEDNPRRRLSEDLNPLGASEESPTSDLLRHDHSRLGDVFLRNSTDIHPTLENWRRSLAKLDDEDLTSAEVSQLCFDKKRSRKATEPHLGLSTSFQPTNFQRPSFALGGESRFHSPAYPRESLRSVVLAPASRGGDFNLSPCHSASYRADFGSTLMPSHFVLDAGLNRRGGSMTPEDLDISRRGGRVSLDNVTQRDTKRPSERPRDREYQRRFSVGVPRSHVSPSVPLGGHAWPREDPFSPPARSIVAVEVGSPANLYGQCNGDKGNGDQTRDGRGDGTPYHIRMICAGDTVQHVVWPSMPIADLIVDAGHIFGLDPAGISLVLFSASPVTLRRETTISGPPLVAPNSSVMGFSFPPQPVSVNPVLGYGPRTPPIQTIGGHSGFTYAAPPTSPFVSSKLLSTFKLPKFDGASKNWKTWDRAFQRFLGLHQLDHVLEDDFLALRRFGLFPERKKRTNLSTSSWRIRSLWALWLPNTSVKRQSGTAMKLMFSFMMGTCSRALSLPLSCFQS